MIAKVPRSMRPRAWWPSVNVEDASGDRAGVGMGGRQGSINAMSIASVLLPALTQPMREGIVCPGLQMIKQGLD